MGKQTMSAILKNNEYTPLFFHDGEVYATFERDYRKGDTSVESCKWNEEEFINEFGVSFSQCVNNLKSMDYYEMMEQRRKDSLVKKRLRTMTTPSVFGTIFGFYTEQCGRAFNYRIKDNHCMGKRVIDDAPFSDVWFTSHKVENNVVGQISIPIGNGKYFTFDYEEK